MRVNDAVRVGDDTFTILEFLDEPNRGLCRIESRGWGLTVPTALLDEIERLRGLLYEVSGACIDGEVMPSCEDCGLADDYDGVLRCDVSLRRIPEEK